MCRKREVRTVEKWGKVMKCLKSIENKGKVGNVRGIRESYNKFTWSAGSRQPVWWGNSKKVKQKLGKSSAGESGVQMDCLVRKRKKIFGE